MEDNVVRLQDVAKATGAHTTRVSEALSALGIGPGRLGRRGATLSLADGIRVAAARRLIDLGMQSAVALDVVRQIETADLVRIVAEDRGTWLAVGADPASPDKFLFALLGAEDLAEIADGVRGNAIRLVDLYSAAHDILRAALERKQAAAAPQQEPHVTTYTSTDRELNGVIIEGLAIAVVERGRGKRVRLTVQQARAIAEQLLAVAAEHDPAGGLN